jgi:hypothetical protein
VFSFSSQTAVGLADLPALRNNYPLPLQRRTILLGTTPLIAALDCW